MVREAIAHVTALTGGATRSFRLPMRRFADRLIETGDRQTFVDAVAGVGTLCQPVYEYD